MARDYTNATKYESSPKQIANREARNKARAMEEKKLGRKLPTDVDVDHKRPMALGGKTTAANIRAIPQSRNSAWRKGQKGYKVKAV
jgi:hypothetical protein